MNIIQKSGNIIVLIIFVIAAFFYFTPDAFSAEVSSHVRIVGTNRTIWYGDVVTDGCSVKDSDGETHNFSQSVAICSLDAASKAGGFTYTVRDYVGTMGLYLEAIAEDSGAADFSSYWLYDVNGQAATVGISNYIVNSGDLLFFHFENPNTDLNKRAINDGISYLRSQQQASGEISGYPGVSGWAAMAFASAGIDPDSVLNNGLSISDFLATNPPSQSSAASEWERNILAITAMGANPYNFGGINYISNLESYYNNSQIGAITQVNDDVFGLLALISAGSSSSIKQDALSFILSHQLPDGGFSWSTTGESDVDDTSASLQALIASQKAGMEASGLADGIDRAKTYLQSSQNSDGGFAYIKGDVSNSSSTAWATMALSSLGMDNDSAFFYLRNSQEENGSFKWQPSQSGETFTSSYAVLALSGKYWPIGIYSAPEPTITPLPTPTSTPAPTATSTPEPSPTVMTDPSPSYEPSSSPDWHKRLVRKQREKIRKMRAEQRSVIREIRERLREEIKNFSKIIKTLRFSW